MKRFFTLLISIFALNSTFAAAEFFVKINNNGNYTVSLNNQTMSSSSNIFRFFDLYNGQYNLKVYSNGIAGRLLFSQTILIEDGYRTVAELDRYNGIRIIDKLPFTKKAWYIDVLQPAQFPPVCNLPQPPKPGCNNGGNYNNGGWNNGNYNQPYNGNPNNYPNGNTGYGYGNLMNDGDLQSLVHAMKNATFEDRMIGIAKTALKNRVLKTNQVHELLQQFTFEPNKLDIAKYCFDKTIDQNNYYTLYNDFTFNNYSAQLEKYINSK